jgi:hypothetical protein
LTAAATVLEQATRGGGSDSFAFSFAALSDKVAEVSEQAMRFAGQTDYKDRIIVDTGATDHICNDLSKFIK